MIKFFRLNRIYNKLKLILVLILLTITCSACVRIEQNISIDTMGNYENLFSAFANKNGCDYLKEIRKDSDACKNELKERLNEIGFTEINNSNNKQEIISSGKIKGNLHELKISDIKNNLIEITDNSKDYFVYKIYDINILYSPCKNKNFLFGNNKCLIEDYILTIKLPVTANSNADFTSNNKRIHTWNIEANSSNQINIKFGMLNIINTIITVITLLVIFVLIKIIGLIRLIKNK